MKITLLLTILFLFLTSISTFTQSNYFNGYIITTEGDTLHGSLAQQSNDKKYDSVKFKDRYRTISFFPNNVQLIQYDDGELYINGIEDNKFVEVLIQGSVSLYKFEKRYIIIKNGEVNTLDFELKKIGIHTNQVKRIDPIWKTVLQKVIFDCIENYDEVIGKINPREKDLIKVISQYNECINGENIISKNKLPWTRFSPGVLGGMRFSNMYFVDKADDIKYLVTQYNDLNNCYGAMLNVSFPRIDRRYSFQFEFIYDHSKYQSLIINETNIRAKYYHLVMGSKNFEFPILLKYQNKYNNITFSFVAGASLDYVEAYADLYQGEILGRIVYNELETDIFTFKKFQKGLVMGIGIGYETNVIGGQLQLRFLHGDDFRRLGYFEAYDRYGAVGLTAYLR